MTDETAEYYIRKQREAGYPDHSKPSQLEQNTGEDYTEEFINKALEGIAKDFCDKKRALELLNKIDEGQCGIDAWDLICDAKDYLK